MKTLNKWFKITIEYIKEEPVSAALQFTTGFVVGMVLNSIFDKE
jgi:hypothetical protein